MNYAIELLSRERNMIQEALDSFKNPEQYTEAFNDRKRKLKQLDSAISKISG